jgi:hypothetical protein
MLIAQIEIALENRDASREAVESMDRAYGGSDPERAEMAAAVHTRLAELLSDG